jgi:dihydropteroate synthase
MGIVNVTPDSFSDGGKFGDAGAAIAHARQLVAEGAGIIDIGGESTRPGAEPVDEQTELQRVIPVIEALVGSIGDVEISIDTTKPAVAEAACRAGATIVNDVSSSLEAVAADRGAGWVAMHTLGPSVSMQDDPTYHDVVFDIATYLADAAERGRAAGVSRIWIDPGIGFGKTTEHNLDLMANLDLFLPIAPVLIGASRKRFVGEIHARSDGISGQTGVTDADDRYEGSVALATWSAHLGVDIVRVHDVRGTVHAVRVVNS